MTKRTEGSFVSSAKGEHNEGGVERSPNDGGVYYNPSAEELFGEIPDPTFWDPDEDPEEQKVI